MGSLILLFFWQPMEHNTITGKRLFCVLSKTDHDMEVSQVMKFPPKNTPKNYQIIQVTTDHWLSIESYGDLGIPLGRKDFVTLVTL